MDLSKLETILLRDAVTHYLKHQIGIGTTQALEYEDILRKIESHLKLLNW